MRCGAYQRKRLERLCRAITRPDIADERLKRNQAGQMVLLLKSPWRDGTTHIVMSPLEFMQRLAPLAPRAQLHLIRFRGVLARHAKLPAQIVPSAPLSVPHPSDHHAPPAHPEAPERISRACLTPSACSPSTSNAARAAPGP